MTIQLTKKELIEVDRILRHYLKNTEWRVFGSRAKGTAKPYSDLDIVLINNGPIPLTTLSALEEAFAESNLTFKVDLADWHRITPEFQEKIRSEWKNII